jgi:magnesium transporter
MQAAIWPFDSILSKSSSRKPQPQQRASIVETKARSGVFGAPRHSSSNQGPREMCRPKWKSWLFGPREKANMALTDEDLRLKMEEESGSIFPRRSLTAKAALDPRLRCTEVDGNGEVIMVDGELKKSELIAKVGGTT